MNKIYRPFTDGALLRSFVEIADCGNLTHAATRLGRTQSAISVQLRKLETEMGTALFVRDGKGMSLTADGEKLLPAAKRVLAEMSKLQPMFAAPLNGKIRVGIPDDFDEGVLERTLADFAQSHPGVDVQATSGCTAGFATEVEKGALDIAVCSGPDNDIGEPLLDQRSVWVSSKDMQLSKSDPVPLAVINHGCWMGELPKATLKQHGRAFNIAFACTGMMSLKAAIRAGIAVGVLYESNVEPDMKVLGPKDGFPALPVATRSILIHPDAPGDLARAMADAIRRAV